MWIKEAQQGLKLGDNMKLRPTYENGIIVVGGPYRAMDASYVESAEVYTVTQKSRNIKTDYVV